MSKTFRQLLESEKSDELLDLETELAIFKYARPREFAELYKNFMELDDPTWTFSDYLKRIVVADGEFERANLTGFKYKSDKMEFETSSEVVDFDP
jgi:hypothetical protein